jgi:hypothetical protein
MTEASPYAEDLCEMLVYGGNNQVTGGYNNYMCSIGKGSYAANILNGLAK